jgi:ATP-binding cassette subfamily G (WHITE) protein 2 (SNQ2)
MITAEIPSLFTQRSIILRHRSSALYHPFVDQIALYFADIPVSLISLGGFAAISYVMVGLRGGVAEWALFFIFIYTSSLAMKAYFRALTAACADEPTAQTFSGLSVLACAMYTGFTIPTPNMVKALKWITHINPLRYAFENLMTNEFHGLVGTCSSIVPQGPPGSPYDGVPVENTVSTAVFHAVLY